jgi:hypothetical protein
MNDLNRLRLGSIVFALVWTVFMVWWTGADDTVSTMLISLSGAIVGATWYGAMRRWAIRRGFKA